MREGVITLNAHVRELLSNDLGAVAGLLFDIGSGRYAAPPRADDAAARAAWAADLARVREQAAASKADREAAQGDLTHTQVQGWLRDLDLALGFRVWVAGNDRNRPYDGGRLADGCLPTLPPELAAGPAAAAVALIDVLWLHPDGAVATALEVEHSTTIYSGIVRMLDLALSRDGADAAHGLFLVAPDGREAEVRAQVQRPAFSRVADLEVRYLPYGDLERHREAAMRFGRGLHPCWRCPAPSPDFARAPRSRARGGMRPAGWETPTSLAPAVGSSGSPALPLQPVPQLGEGRAGVVQDDRPMPARIDPHIHHTGCRPETSFGLEGVPAPHQAPEVHPDAAHRLDRLP